jgi:hypothetical protein
MKDSGSEVVTVKGSHAPSTEHGGIWLSQVLSHLQRAIINFDVLGFSNGALTNLGLFISFFINPHATTSRGAMII